MYAYVYINVHKTYTKIHVSNIMYTDQFVKKYKYVS